MRRNSIRLHSRVSFHKATNSGSRASQRRQFRAISFRHSGPAGHQSRMCSSSSAHVARRSSGVVVGSACPSTSTSGFGFST